MDGASAVPYESASLGFSKEGMQAGNAIVLQADDLKRILAVACTPLRHLGRGAIPEHDVSDFKFRHLAAFELLTPGS